MHVSARGRNSSGAPAVIQARSVSVALVLSMTLAGPVAARQRTIDDFFREFTAEWVRSDPNLAAMTRSSAATRGGRWSAYGIEASEVERYVVYPGQACAYMLGQLKIVELREKARAALGQRFSINQFHNTILTTGTAPLELLERQVDGYIRSAAR